MRRLKACYYLKVSYNNSLSYANQILRENFISLKRVCFFGDSKQSRSLKEKNCNILFVNYNKRLLSNKKGTKIFLQDFKRLLIILNTFNKLLFE